MVASAFIVSIFPVIANTLTGCFRPTRRCAICSGCTAPSGWRPCSSCGCRPRCRILTGLRVAAGLAVIGAIVGEFITGSGIGGIIMVSRQQKRVDKVFAGLLLASLLGIVLFTLINLISRLTLRHWHASEGRICDSDGKANQMFRMIVVATGGCRCIGAGCGKATTTHPMLRAARRFTLQLNWKPEPQFGGFYAARSMASTRATD